MAREKVIDVRYSRTRYSHGTLSRQRKPRPLIERLFLIAVKSRERMEALAPRCGATEDLRGLCAVAAFDLFRALNAAQIPARFAVGQNHCFCLVDGFVVDTTATQFLNADPVDGVWIASVADLADDPGVWRVTVSFATEEEVLAADFWQHWNASERPHALLNFT